TGEIDKSIEVLELWKQTYPRDITPRSDLSGQYAYTGQYDKAAEEAGEALRLDPNVAALYNILGLSFISLNRFDEARAIFEQVVEMKLDSAFLHGHFYHLAFVQGDEATMQRQFDWANGKPGEGCSTTCKPMRRHFPGNAENLKNFFAARRKPTIGMV
ncbi:MAG: hypothetical protein LC776_16075, partial [Acidobacteria bacterium]|nr:hypothetical protein [Acidobacteriota bacterium]